MPLGQWDELTEEEWESSGVGHFLVGARLPEGARPVAGLEYGSELQAADPDGRSLRWVRLPGGPWLIAAEAGHPGEELSDAGLLDMLRASSARALERVGRNLSGWCVVWRTFDAGGDGRMFWDLLLLGRGWHQVDTPEDASYLGHWVHVEHRQLVAYVEGDVYRYSAADVEGLRELLGDLRRMYGGAQIDAYTEAERVAAAGLGEFLHAADRRALGLDPGGEQGGEQPSQGVAE
jgi:hypothetical protein